MRINVWRVARYILLVLFLVLAIGVLGLRYYLLPHIDHYRPQIVAYIGQQLSLNIELGRLSADWRGLNPKIEFTNLVIRDPDSDEEFLRLPELSAGLSWRSFFEGHPVFQYFYTEGLQLDVRRDEQGNWWLLNHALNSTTNTNNASLEPALLWLARQRHISISNSSVRWTDEYSRAPTLSLQQVHLEWLRRGKEHKFMLSAVPPADMAQQLTVRVNALPDTSLPQEASSLLDYRGRIHLELSNLDLLALAPWLSMPKALRSGRVDLQASMDFSDAQWGMLSTEVVLQDGRWRDEERDGVSASLLRFYTAAPFADYLALIKQNGPAVTIPMQLHGQQVYFRWQELFSEELGLQDIRWHGALGYDSTEGWQVQAQQLALQNQDIQADLQGSWRELEPDSSGHLQLKGVVADLGVERLVNYLPLTVEPDALEWMRTSLLSGRVSDAYLTLDGAIDDFPYGRRLGGEFSLTGAFKDVVIDYLPPELGQKGWPRVELAAGKVSLQNAHLHLEAEQANMPLEGHAGLQLSLLQADIPNLEVGAVLQVQGHSQAKAASYLALLRRTPLGGLLGNVFDEAQGEGTWSVPLHLTVPLTHSEDTQVTGAMQFKGGAVKLMPEAPWLRDLQGELLFNERGVSAKGLRAKLLGGPVSIQGRMEPGQKGLVLKGSLLAESVGAYIDSQALRRLQGELNYETVLLLDEQAHFGMEFASTLVGLQSAFPSPLHKAAEAAMPLNAKWYSDAEGMNSWLDIRLQSDPVTTLRLQRINGDDSGSFFRAMSVLAGKTGPFPTSGTTVDGIYNYLDLDAWNTAVDEFSLPWVRSTSAVVGAAGRPLLPPMLRSRVQVEQGRFLGAVLDKLTLTNQESANGHFRLDISSAQTAGMLQGQMRSRVPVGRWKMHFNRLSLGRKEIQSTEQANPEIEQEAEVSEEMTLPDIEVSIDKLTLYERNVGSLSLVGRALNEGHQWQLEQLQLNGEGVQLQGEGYWQLRGPQRGLHLSTQATIESLGNYLSQLSLPGVLSAGHGHADLALFWRGFPWSLERGHLEGQLTMHLQNGRFSQVGSRSARILELISLQSLSRLVSFNSNPAGLFKEGFPFDDWSGSIDIRDGVLQARDYRVAGPVGLIELEGHMQLETEALDFTASVYPKLDVSGAAVAAGVLVNPFIGLGTFLAQWLLQEPLAQGMAMRYRLTGTLDKPEVQEMAVPRQ